MGILPTARIVSPIFARTSNWGEANWMPPSDEERKSCVAGYANVGHWTKPLKEPCWVQLKILGKGGLYSCCTRFIGLSGRAEIFTLTLRAYLFLLINFDWGLRIWRQRGIFPAYKSILWRGGGRSPAKMRGRAGGGRHKRNFLHRRYKSFQLCSRCSLFRYWGTTLS